MVIVAIIVATIIAGVKLIITIITTIKITMLIIIRDNARNNKNNHNNDNNNSIVVLMTIAPKKRFAAWHELCLEACDKSRFHLLTSGARGSLRYAWKRRPKGTKVQDNSQMRLWRTLEHTPSPKP